MTDIFVFERKDKTIGGSVILHRKIALSMKAAQKIFGDLRKGQWFVVQWYSRDAYDYSLYEERIEFNRVESFERLDKEIDAIRYRRFQAKRAARERAENEAKRVHKKRESRRLREKGEMRRKSSPVDVAPSRKAPRPAAVEASRGEE